MKSNLGVSSTGEVYRRGGVGDRREIFCLRCRDFRERIDPAQDLTLFCFLLDFLDIEDRLETVGSIDGKGTSSVASGELGAVSIFFDSLVDDELVGLDFGDESPEVISCPKNDHFFADLGVLGAEGEARDTSERRGNELRLLGIGRLSFDPSKSRPGSAVRGRGSLIL